MKTVFRANTNARKWYALLSVSGIVAAPTIVQASPKSQTLVEQGVKNLAALRWQDALSDFQAAARSDPRDTEALFFEGVALNRLGESALALDRLQRAVNTGYSNPDAAFETGWALVSLERASEAVVQLEAYEQAQPGRAQTQEFLGRAYTLLGRYDQASSAFTEALRRDSRLQPTVSFWQAVLENARNNAEAARGHVAGLAAAYNTPFGAAMRYQRQGLATQPNGDIGGQSNSPLTARVFSGVGYNNNVFVLGNNQPIPPGQRRRGAAFFELGAGVDYTRSRRNGDAYSLGYSFYGTLNRGASQTNIADHTISATYQRTFNPRWTGSLRVADNYTQLLGGDNYRNQIAVRPAVTYHHSPRQSTELSYNLARDNYLYRGFLPVRDRDGSTHTIALSHAFAPSSKRYQARVGLFHVMSRTKGSDYDYDGNGLFAGVSGKLSRAMTGDVYYSRSFDRYDNKNSFTGFTRRRSSDVDSFNLQLTHALRAGGKRPINAYARYSINRDNANVKFFNYRQNIISAGLNISF